MLAIIQAGGKQYKVKPGDELEIERSSPGKSKTLKLNQVLLFSKESSVEVGRPWVKGAYCEAECLGEIKAPKVISYKYIRREDSSTKIGHRQKYLKIRIKSIHKGN